MSWIERWSVVAVMVGVAGVVCLVACGVGWVLGARSYWEAVGWGLGVGAGHGVVSVVAGVLAGWCVGMRAEVGGHLGMYHVLSPFAVVARVRWLERHRPGFLRAGFLAVFFGWYLVIAVGMVAGGVWWFGGA